MTENNRTVVRTILVLSGEPAIAQKLRERLPDGFAHVRWTSHVKFAADWRNCYPWPWLVVLAVENIDKIEKALIESKPTIIWTLGEKQIILEGVNRNFASWREMLNDVDEMVSKNLDGLSFAHMRGINLPNGECLVNAEELEATLGAYPKTIQSKGADRRRADKSNQTLSQHNILWRLVRSSGQLSLQKTGDKII